MNNYLCKICGYIYIPSENNNITFEELPNDWLCPICQVGKEKFEKIK